MKALDLFCGAGGASMGLYRAGFEVTGVDINPQPRYPFTFIQGNALAMPLDGYDLIWASPPCQHYTQMLNHGLTPRSKHPDLIAPVRQMLIDSGIPYVIENVANAPLIDPIMLCGEMFNLRVMRHRFFECSFAIEQPAHPKHRGKGIRKTGDGGYYYRVYGHETGKKQWGAAMGIDWMKYYELAQAIPPAFSQWIGEQFMWQYQQSSGELSLDGQHIANGYSGFGDGKNNPAKQDVPDIGPIPVGQYTIGPSYHDTQHGPVVMHLWPQPQNEMFGRDGFLIHGDSAEHFGSASHGCIIMRRDIREQISASKDRQLTVIA